MSLIRFDNVKKSFGGDFVLDGVSLRVEEAERIGLIGRNGTGKSTVFRLITGELEAESGVIERMRRARVACLAQIPNVDPATTIFEIVLHSFQELLEMEEQLRELEEALVSGGDEALDRYSVVQDAFTRRGGYEFRNNARRVLHGLGFSAEEFDLPFQALSGGQRTRLMLALVLLQDADLLLLDEPENHLDLKAREWLESYLLECGKTVVVISHDRRMLNAVATRIIEIERGEARSYPGNYEAYLKAKALLREQQMKEFERQQEFIRKEEVWIERFRYKATKARQVQSRIKRLEKLELVDAPDTELDTASFNLGGVVRSGTVVLAAEGLKMAYDSLRLYEGVSFEVHRGERLGISGANGSGKTTLLRQLAGQHAGLAGEVRLGYKVALGYYDQHHDALNEAGDVLSATLAAKPELTPGKARTFLGKFLFTGDDVFKPIAALSGGERSRVALARLILSGANLLLLDEPTNHLDIASREALEAALAEFAGTLVIVSHDRALIDRLVDKLVLLEDGRTTVHLGNYTTYREKVRQIETATAPARTQDVLRVRDSAKATREQSKEQERELRKQRRRLEQIEGDIEALEEVIAGHEQRFAGVDPADYQTVQALHEEYEGLRTDLKAMYEEWENLAEAIHQK